MSYWNRMEVRILFQIVLLPAIILLQSCGDVPREAIPDPSDTSATTDVPAGVDSGVSAAVPAISFEEQVIAAYAREAIAIPKRVQDSIAVLNDPRRIEAAIHNYVSQRDSGVRRAIAARFRISIDSVATIVDQENPAKP